MRWLVSEMVFLCFEIVFESFLLLIVNLVEIRVSKVIILVSGILIIRLILFKEIVGIFDDRRVDMILFVIDVMLVMNLVFFYFLMVCL